jgi:hypothetical protein
VLKIDYYEHMAKPKTDPLDRIATLEDELKQRDSRIKELTNERDEERELVSKMREHVEDCDAQIQRWIEAFDMEQNDRGVWEWRASFVEGNEWFEKYDALLREWNRFVPEYNAMLALVDERRQAGTLVKRERGRPLAATPEQRQTVFSLREQGVSLRGIADEVGLNLQTVRTLIGKIDGTDRTSKRLQRIASDRAAAARWRARKRTRDGLPKHINETLAKGRELVKEAKGLR